MTTTNKELATKLYAIAAGYPTEPTTETEEVYSDGTTTIKARAYAGAIKAIADKFDKGIPKGGASVTGRPRPYKTPRQSKFSIRLFNKFIEEGETENARNYARIYDEEF